MGVIPKPNKPHYSAVKAYYPIALLNYIGKVLEKLMATRLSLMAELHNILHADQSGGCPKCLAINAAMALIHKVEANAGNCFITSALFLDVRGTFDNVSSTCLLTTMHTLSCPTTVMSWCSSFLSDRTTALLFDGRADTQ
jgi:hypothetical protein